MQRAQQCLPKSPRLYADVQSAARQDHHRQKARRGRCYRRAPACVLIMIFMPPALVLDTNVVLDWLVFDNAESVQLREAILAGAVRWIATPEMRREFGYILEGGTLAAWAPDPAAIESTWDRHCLSVPTPAPASAIGRPRCSDRDDQMFVDLAIAESARWLVTRDRALLKLARRLRPFDIEVVTPPRWTLPQEAEA
jgi:uncharacterized protein